MNDGHYSRTGPTDDDLARTADYTIPATVTVKGRAEFGRFDGNGFALTIPRNDDGTLDIPDELVERVAMMLYARDRSAELPPTFRQALEESGEIAELWHIAGYVDEQRQASFRDDARRMIELMCE